MCRESQIQIGSTSLANLILTPAPAETQMDTWIIQQILLTPKILTTDRQVTDVVMQESRVSDQLGEHA